MALYWTWGRVELSLERNLRIWVAAAAAADGVATAASTIVGRWRTSSPEFASPDSQKSFCLVRQLGPCVSAVGWAQRTTPLAALASGVSAVESAVTDVLDRLRIKLPRPRRFLRAAMAGGGEAE